MTRYISRLAQITSITILLILTGACVPGSFSQNENDSGVSSVPVHWSVDRPESSEALLVFEVAGAYEKIGFKLGEWYRDNGYHSRPLRDGEREKTLKLVGFYESINPAINDQMRGFYAAFDLDYGKLADGIILSDSNGIEILIPGLINQHSCSVVFARPKITTDRHGLLGRNYDFPGEIGTLTLLFTYPEEGYPTAIITPRTPGLTAADGINSRGLALGFASVNDPGYTPPAEEAVISSFFYRYILEHSASVEEALKLIKTIPISFVPSHPNGIITHILLADKSGDSAVVEFMPEGIVVSRSNDPYQILTNNLWVDREARLSCNRYQLAVDRIENKSGPLDEISMMELMNDLHGSTQYSVVYDLNNLTLRLSLKEDSFNALYIYSLSDYINKTESGIQ